MSSAKYTLSKSPETISVAAGFLISLSNKLLILPNFFKIVSFSIKNDFSFLLISSIDISVESVSKKEQSFFIENEIILKKLGRIKNLHNKDLDKPAATLMVSGDLFKVYFDEDIDLELVKKNLTTRQNKYQEEMDKISQRLANKSFVDRAPKDIVDQEKTNYNNLKNDVERISITIKGI